MRDYYFADKEENSNYSLVVEQIVVDLLILC